MANRYYDIERDNDQDASEIGHDTMDVDRKTYMRGLVAMFGNEILEVLKEQGFTVVKTEQLDNHIAVVKELRDTVKELLIKTNTGA